MTDMHQWPYRDDVPDGSINRVVVYERTGSDTDLSLQRQEATIRDYLANHPQWRVLGVYRDAGSSAFRRPGLQQMLAAATAGQFDAVVVHQVDRLTRRIEDLNTILRTLQGASVTLHSATEPLDTSTHHGKLVASIGSLAEFARAEPDAFLPPMKRRLHRHRSRRPGRRSGD